MVRVTWTCKWFVAALLLGAASAQAKEVTLVAQPERTTRPAFTAAEPVSGDARAQVKPYKLPLSVSDIVNRSSIPYTGDALLEERLSRNGFVVSPEYQQGDVVSFYKDLAERDAPVYITTDSLLHLFHVQFDVALRETEEKRLIPLMVGFTKSMVERSLEQHEQLADPLLKDAARRNLAYFSVALALIEGGKRSGPAHPLVREAVERELALIDAHAGQAPSALFGYDEDYSQYVPRGHYTRSPELSAYFRAMMWYGRMTMLLKGTEPGITDALVTAEDARAQTTQALLISSLLSEDTASARTELREPWETVYAVTSFFVGTSDDLTPTEYAAQVREVLGASFDWTQLASDTTFTALRDGLAAVRSPRIYGGTGDITVLPPFSPEQLDEVLAPTKGMRLMGQRFIPDSYMFQRLVFPSVGAFVGDGEPFTLGHTPGGPKRTFPRGLDVLAALGSDRALEALTAEGDTRYEGYDETVRALRGEFAGLPEADWRQSLYWCWLDALRGMVEPAPRGYPTYMRSDAWRSRMLQGALASWASLRHDTILYAKQSYTPLAGAAPGDDHGPPPMPLGYVEPLPQLYARLLTATRTMRSGLEGLDVLDETTGRRLDALGDVVDQCLRISRRELEGRWLEDADYGWIQSIGRTLESSLESVDEDAASPQLIADVHTDGNSGQVLEEGVGGLQKLTVVWNDPDGKLHCSVGPILSYYEFKHAADDRLTDESWRAMLESEDAPQLPSWTDEYLGFANDEE
jgi:hypothetical protein